MTDTFGNALAGQTVSVLADNGATVAPTVTTLAGRYSGDLCYQPDGGDQCGHSQHQQQQSEPERDIYRRCQHGEDR
ncbi:Ig-like domain-containing protein [Escherichia coli]|uniref:Ig-like domain-containing protein n=1 Tax=Escherichia coli TaxID=562 RepID=UPI00388F4EA6